MGTTLNKLEYLDETKSQIKTALNQFNAGITDETTFREYVDKINDIYDNWEKVTGTGTDITLNNTKANAKLELNLKGNSIQDGTPTPDNPVNIQVVKGEQVVKVENKNLFILTLQTTTLNGITCTKNEDGTYTLNGTATAQTLFSLQTIYLDTSKIYTLTGTPSGGNNNWFIAGANFTDYGSGSTATPSRSGITFSIVVQNGTTCNNIVFKPMLEYGSTATPYTPHQEQTQTISLGDIELCKIGTYQDYIYKNNGNWYKKEQIGKYTFTGNENWFKHTTTSNNLFYISPVYNPIVSNMKKPSTNNVALECYSEMAQYRAVNTMAGNSVIGINPSVAGDIYVGTSLSGISDRDVFKTYLQSHITNFYYLLENSNDIQITNETLIEQLNAVYKSYEDQTNITSSYGSGNAPFIISASALKKGGN